ncbi:MAG: tetratricopeptide repeat protein [Polyangiaceae bacterium]
MRRFRARLTAVGALLTLLSVPGLASALSSSDARGRAQLSVQAVERELPNVQSAAKRVRQTRLTPAQRVAAGDILYHNKDYARAIDTFSQVVELHRQGKADANAHADGLFFLAESYFASKQLLSARRHYVEVLDKAGQGPYAKYAGRSVSRLVDVSLRTGTLEKLDDVFAKLNQLPGSDASGSLQYARGKLLFAKKEYDAAKSAIGAVAAGSPYNHQAQYLLGVVMVKQATPEAPSAEAAATDQPEIVQPGTEATTPAMRARYAAAIEQFRRVTRLKADTTAHRHVVDLAWMAIGRLFYESDNFLDAAEAYSHVDRTSPEFSTMLYELAWVYVRLGDYQRAQRALEVLSITDPESLRLADGSLLRADLMLRSGQFDKALTLYRSVRSRFDPIREQVDTFLKEVTDPAVYYDRLVDSEGVSEGAGGNLSPVVVQWAREEAENDRAFAVIDDVSASRDLIRRSRRLILKLNAVLGAPTRFRAFPELQASMEATLGLLNRTGVARLTLAQGMDDEAGSAGGELAQVRAERRSLMKRMGFLPVTAGDFAQREAAGERQWNRVGQKIQRLELEADRLQALINGLRRVLKDGSRFGVTSDANSRVRFQAEIEANERDLESYRKRIKEYRDAVDMGRVQIGFGDQRFVEDDRVRRRFRQVFAREVALVAAGQDSASAAAYAKGIGDLLARADRVEDSLEGTKSRLEREAEERSRGLKEAVDREVANIEKYAGDLDELDQQARLLIGEVAMKNFGLVRDRLKSVVLRADVGIVQQAWEVREEQRHRVRNLQRERAREEQNLNDELREVLDDAGGDQ